MQVFQKNGMKKKITIFSHVQYAQQQKVYYLRLYNATDANIAQRPGGGKD